MDIGRHLGAAGLVSGRVERPQCTIIKCGNITVVIVLTLSDLYVVKYVVMLCMFFSLVSALASPTLS